MIFLGDDVCPICGDKFVKVSSDLDSLGCPNCGSLHLDGSEGLVEVNPDGSFPVDFHCLDCGFKWVESRFVPKKSPHSHR